MSSFSLSCFAEFFFSKLLLVLTIRASSAGKLVLCVALVLVSLLWLGVVPSSVPAFGWRMSRSPKDRKSTRLNSSHKRSSRMPSSA